MSAGLSEAGWRSLLRPAWQGKRIKPLLAAALSRELLRVLADPKFRWSAADLEALLSELLLWCETWAGSLEACPQRVGDRHDQVALDLAVSVKAEVLVSDDADLMGWQDPLNPLLILDPADFPGWLPPIG